MLGNKLLKKLSCSGEIRIGRSNFDSMRYRNVTLSVNAESLEITFKHFFTTPKVIKIPFEFIIKIEKKQCFF